MGERMVALSRTLGPYKGTHLGGEGEASIPFFENQKGPDCVHSWIKVSIQSVVLRVSRTKNSKIFPCFFS